MTCMFHLLTLIIIEINNFIEMQVYTRNMKGKLYSQNMNDNIIRISKQENDKITAFKKYKTLKKTSKTKHFT